MESKTKVKIIKLLLSSGLITEEQAKLVHSGEKLFRNKILKSMGKGMGRGGRGAPVQHDVSIVEVIDSMKLKHHGKQGAYITEEMIMQTLADGLGLPFIKIDPLKVDSDLATKTISQPYAVKHQMIPLSLSGNTLTMATSNPFEQQGIEGLKQTTGRDIKIVVAAKSNIMKIITEFYGFKSSVASAHRDISSQVDLANLEQYVELKSASEMDATADQHIVNAVEYLLRYAYDQRASDIHIEPKREHSIVRLRIDGKLHNIHKMPILVHPPFISRIKMLARMDIAEKRKPQDGRIKTAQDGKEIELRVSSLPVSFGEKIVIRIFDPTVLLQDIASLGFFEREHALFKSFITAPFGLILVTGPTGSGKTTTLYSALNEISSPEINLTTIEDPVEMMYEAFNQTSVQPQIGITFSTALRTILRQDPDIIMVGEIRDSETADNAIQAALTGHLVLSTLHTNDATSSVVRLMDLGVQPFLINSVLTGLVAQRLLRKVCSHCAQFYYLSEDECTMLELDFKEVKNYHVSIGRGCAECRGTGYLGRTAIYEVVEMTEALREAVEKKLTPQALRKIATREGMVSLRDCAIQKMLMRVTSFDEVVRVTGILT